MVIHIKKLTVKDAVDIICNTVRLDKFQTTPESQRAIEDLALAARAKAALSKIKPGLEVSAQNGTVSVKAEAPVLHQTSIRREIESIVKAIPDVKETKVEIIPSGIGAFG